MAKMTPASRHMHAYAQQFPYARITEVEADDDEDPSVYHKYTDMRHTSLTPTKIHKTGERRIGLEPIIQHHDPNLNRKFRSSAPSFEGTNDDDDIVRMNDFGEDGGQNGAGSYGMSPFEN